MFNFGAPQYRGLDQLPQVFQQLAQGPLANFLQNRFQGQNMMQGRQPFQQMPQQNPFMSGLPQQAAQQAMMRFPGIAQGMQGRAPQQMPFMQGPAPIMQGQAPQQMPVMQGQAPQQNMPSIAQGRFPGVMG